jgi:cytochrome c oxidase assembly protein subunit 15
MVLVVAIVITGAAVRLTDSGLGCNDWPTCSYGRVTPPLQFHAIVEFSNRMVTSLVCIFFILTFVAAFKRRPFRRDLAMLSGGLVLGVVAEAIMGKFVVYSHLNPYVVMCHFLTAIPIVVCGVALYYRSTRQYQKGSGTRLVPRGVVRLSWALACLLGIVIVAGAATSGAGPHPGASTKMVAHRLPIALRSIAEIHASFALLLIGAAGSLAIILHIVQTPERVRKTIRLFFATIVAQGVIGYTQYFTHLPSALVLVHVAGATVLVVGMTQYVASLTYHPKEERFAAAKPEALEGVA